MPGSDVRCSRCGREFDGEEQVARKTWTPTIFQFFFAHSMSSPKLFQKRWVSRFSFSKTVGVQVIYQSTLSSGPWETALSKYGLLGPDSS
jgi:hypothetical protein